MGIPLIRTDQTLNFLSNKKTTICVKSQDNLKCWLGQEMIRRKNLPLRSHTALGPIFYSSKFFLTAHRHGACQRLLLMTAACLVLVSRENSPFFLQDPDCPLSSCYVPITFGLSFIFLVFPRGWNHSRDFQTAIALCCNADKYWSVFAVGKNTKKCSVDFQGKTNVSLNLNPERHNSLDGVWGGGGEEEKEEYSYFRTMTDVKRWAVITLEISKTQTSAKLKFSRFGNYESSFFKYVPMIDAVTWTALTSGKLFYMRYTSFNLPPSTWAQND